VSVVGIVPVNAIDSGLLSRLAVCLEERFLYRCVVRGPLTVPKTVLNNVRKQLFFGSICGRLSAAFDPREELLLGVTDFDLYKTSHQFIFGSSSPAQRCAVVSIHRLRAEFYGEKPDENALFQRLLKESVHEVGHTLGLKHCYNARCAMYYSSSIVDTDNKYPQFCDVCDKRSRASR
jgi:archaemetzincin